MKQHSLISFVLTTMFVVVTSLVSHASEDKPATSVLRGVVVDAASGEELTGATIKVSGTDVVVYSEADGSFTLDLTKTGLNDEVVLVVTLVSFETISLVVEADGLNAPAVIALSEK